MKTEGAATALENLREGATEAAEQVKNFTVRAGHTLNSAYESTRRGIRKIKTSTDDAIEEARHEITEHPLAIVAATALGAFAIGMLTGWIVQARRKS